jgi:hypothetical protein
MANTRNSYKILIGVPVGKSACDDIKIDLSEKCCKNGRLMELVQDRVKFTGYGVAMQAGMFMISFSWL